MSVTLAPREDRTLVARERLEALCDPGSLQIIRSAVRSTAMGDHARPGDGVLAGAGEVGGRPVFCYAQDPTYAGGSLGGQHAGSIVRVLELADRAGAPVVGFVSSGGARMQEGIEALGGYGRIFHRIVRLTRRVPQISIITGLSAGGGAYSPALTDWVVMTEDSSMFLTGPGIVREALGEDVSAAQLGGTRVHQRNGVCHFVAPDDFGAADLARDLLAYLPGQIGDRPPRATPCPPALGNPGDVVPAEHRRSYDVRAVIARLVDGGELLEVSAGWARNLVTAFARIDGRPVGVIANQPKWLGGVLDAESSQKGARFVSQCDKFGIPLVVLVDTPGYMPGSRQESAGVIRFGATLVHAFAQASVARITVVLRKAFGGAYITMNSKDLGADYVFAWPQAEIGVMAAASAVGLIHRRELASSSDPDALRSHLQTRYEEDHLHSATAARTGYVDELIEPGHTRERLAWALESLAGGR